MSKYIDFKGRSSRSEFWYYTLIITIIYLIAAILDVALFGSNNDKGLFVPLVAIVHLLPGLAVCIRRFHDTDRRGWWILLLGLLFPYIFLCLRGTHGPNRFGPEPIETASSTAIPPNHTLNPQSPAGRSALATRDRDMVGELERLAKLRADGHLSDVEYEVMKSRTLSGNA